MLHGPHYGARADHPRRDSNEITLAASTRRDYRLPLMAFIQVGL